MELWAELLPLETLLPPPEKCVVDPPELLAAAGVVPGPVRNRSCLIVLFRVAMVIANMA